MTTWQASSSAILSNQWWGLDLKGNNWPQLKGTSHTTDRWSADICQWWYSMDGQWVTIRWPRSAPSRPGAELEDGVTGSIFVRRSSLWQTVTGHYKSPAPPVLPLLLLLDCVTIPGSEFTATPVKHFPLSIKDGTGQLILTQSPYRLFCGVRRGLFVATIAISTHHIRSLLL